MDSCHRFGGLVVLLGVVLCAAPARAKEVDVKALTQKMQKFYENSRDLKARFVQTVESALGGRKQQGSGEVALKKPGKMRWDYQKPEKKLMVSDGKTLWVYEPEDQQAFKQDLRNSTLPISVSFLFGQGKLSDEFEIAPTEEKSKPDEVVLKLIPKLATAAYRYLLFTIDEKSGLVLATTVYDQQGGVTNIQFLDVKTNQGLEDKKFSFSPPRGTHILNPQ